MAQHVKDIEQARKIVAANTTPRQAALDKLRAYVKGTQYEGRSNFFDTSKPLRERAPCFVYPIAQIAIGSHVDMCLGEGRWDGFYVEDNADGDDPLGSDQDEAANLDNLLESLWKRASLRSTFKKAMVSAMREGSVAVVVGSVPGPRGKWSKLKLELIRGRNFTVKRADSGEVTQLEVLYPYIKTVIGRDGPEAKAMWFRRVIDAVNDTTYQAVEAKEEHAQAGKMPRFVEDEKLPHGLGFCPVHVYEFDTDADDGRTEGQALHAMVLDEIDCLNFALSSWHRGANIAGNPQLVETGVEKGYNPSGEAGRVAIITGQDIRGGAFVDRENTTKARGGARKMGPDTIWTYENPQSAVNYLTLPPGAMESIAENAADIRAKLQEVLGVVLTDPSTQDAKEVSGRALREHHKRQVERCDNYRTDFADNLALPLLRMILEVVLYVNATGAPIPLRGFDKAKDALEKLLPLGGPDVCCAWGPYFDVGGEESKLEQDQAIEANQGGLITKRTAVEKIAPRYGIENIDGYMKDLQKEADEKAEADKAVAEHAASLKPVPGALPGAPKPPGAAPPAGKPTPPKVK